MLVVSLPYRCCFRYHSVCHAFVTCSRQASDLFEAYRWGLVHRLVEVCRWPVDDPPRGVWLISWCPTRLTLSSVVVQPASGSRHSSSPCFSLFPGLVEVQPSRHRRATPRSSDLAQLLRRVPRNADPGARSRHLGHDSRSPRQQVAPLSAPESLAPGAQREAAFISAAVPVGSNELSVATTRVRGSAGPVDPATERGCR